jgi:protein-S-isoprenylcysteine O-methyltransferase Ste14
MATSRAELVDADPRPLSPILDLVPALPFGWRASLLNRTLTSADWFAITGAVIVVWSCLTLCVPILGTNAGRQEMSESIDNPNVVIPPPIAWALAIVAGLGLGWLYPLRFVAASIPNAWVGGGLFAVGFALAIWAIVTFLKAATRFETNKSATTVVTHGPYRFSRNPIYIGMFLGLTGLAIGLDDLWVLAMLAPFYLVIRHGVIAREEAYLERKFGAVYLGYKSRVRRWL